MNKTTNLAGAGAPSLGTAGTQYEIDITIDDPKTIDLLSKGNYQLYLFKVSSSSIGGGKPTVWAATKDYGPTTKITWTESYAAYAEKVEMGPGLVVDAFSSKPLSLGQTLEVGDHAVTQVSRTGTPSWITVHNNTTDSYTCGLSQPNPFGKMAPICAFPLYGLNKDLIQPVEQVALVFATQAKRQGAVVEGSLGPTILVDLTSTQTVSVRYDINKTWQYDPTAPVSVIDDGNFVQTVVTSPRQVRSFAATDPSRVTNVVVSDITSNGAIFVVATGPTGHLSNDRQHLFTRLTSGTSPVKGGGNRGEYIVEFHSTQGYESWWAVCVDDVGYDNIYEFELTSRFTVGPFAR